MVDVHLYDSTICRLCAADNGNEYLFVSETGESDLCSLVNRYLPLKVRRCVFKTPVKRTATWFPTLIFVSLPCYFQLLHWSNVHHFMHRSFDSSLVFLFWNFALCLSLLLYFFFFAKHSIWLFYVVAVSYEYVLPPYCHSEYIQRWIISILTYYLHFVHERWNICSIEYKFYLFIFCKIINLQI